MPTHDYTCPVHGTFEVVLTGPAPDAIECPQANAEPAPDQEATPGERIRCRATWTPSCAIRTPNTHRLALLDWARSNNPW